MECKRNYAKINNKGKLEIHTDNGFFINGKSYTNICGKMFEISGDDLMKIYALLEDKEITCLYNLRERGYSTFINNYMIVGGNVEKKCLMERYIKLLQEVEDINKKRHWWERKIKIDNKL